MLLGFSKNFPWKEPTYFKEKILLATTGQLQGTVEGGKIIRPKLHSIREGRRWKAGNTIQMAYGIRSKNYEQFNRDFPELQTVRSVQNISIDGAACRFAIYKNDEWEWYPAGHPLVDDIARNDGFENTAAFWRWFWKPLNGQLVHWTELKY